MVEPVITIFKKQSPSNECFTSICLPRGVKLTSTFLNEGEETEFTQIELRHNDQFIFNYRSSRQEQRICRMMKNNPPLVSMYGLMTGAKPYQVGKGIPPQTKETLKTKPFTSYVKNDSSWTPYMRGRTIGRFVNKWEKTHEYIKYGEWLAEPRNKAIFDSEKIFVRQTGDQLVATYDNGNVSNDTLYSVYINSEESCCSLSYLLGILNSSPMNWYYQIENYLEVGKPMAQVKANAIKNLPISIGTDELRTMVETCTHRLLYLCQERFIKKFQLINYIQKAYEPKSITERIENFDQLSFKDFCDELKKQKVKLTASQKMELLSLYEDTIKEIEAMTLQIQTAQSTLDETVYEIYGISEEDKKHIQANMQIKL